MDFLPAEQRVREVTLRMDFVHYVPILAESGIGRIVWSPEAGIEESLVTGVIRWARESYHLQCIQQEDGTWVVTKP